MRPVSGVSLRRALVGATILAALSPFHAATAQGVGGAGSAGAGEPDATQLPDTIVTGKAGANSYTGYAPANTSIANPFGQSVLDTPGSVHAARLRCCRTSRPARWRRR